APEILSFVDLVFRGPATRLALAPEGENLVRHVAIRPPAQGCVDLWPLEIEATREEGDAWDPVDAQPVEGARKRLARKIAT
ncbi:hypothetical protein ABTL61_20045, partial [Acinetobacter baumannii]